MTTVVCENKNQNLGSVKEGTIVNVEYTITNAGTEDLYITDVVTSCGCTAPNWLRTPVKPNESTTITLNFNSTGRRGLNTKEARVAGNFQHQVILLFTVTVV